MSAQAYYGGDGYGGEQGQSGQGQYGAGSQHDNRPPPPNGVPYPWRAEWEARENGYVFVNGQTGERCHEFPRGGEGQSHGGGASYDGGYGGGQHGGPSGPGGYERPGPEYQQNQGGSGYPMGPQGGSSSEHHEEEKKKKSGFGWMGAALGVAAGVAGGAFLMHEGQEAKEHFEEDKYKAEERIDGAEYRTEERVDRLGRDIEDAPEDVAGFVGRRVGDVEDIPQDFDRFGDRVERRFEDAKDDVEDAPEKLANWGGEEVGKIERFGDDVDNYGDRIQDSYEGGRDSERYDDDNDRNDGDRW